MKTLKIFVAFAFIFFATTSSAQGCHESTIVSPSPFMGNNGEIFKLADGSFWEVKYEYEYLYAYSPQVIICPSKGKLSVESKTLNVQSVSGTAAPRSKLTKVEKEKGKEQSQVLPDSVIESQIDGTFNGWEGETIFKLTNGQIWQQSSYAYTYHYAYRPELMIFPSGGGYKMKVNGVDGAISVKRLR